MILIALSGGIGSGKSTVARMLAELGAIVVDHDRITHQTYAQGTPGWQQVVDEFGPRVIGADGEIDRKVLGPIAFNTPGGTLRLLRITQPAVMPTAMRTFAEKARQGYQVGVLESAVVIDTGDHWYFDQVWVTYAPEDLAARHAAERQGSNVTFEQAKQRMRHQHPGELKASYADLIIRTDRTLEETRASVLAAWRNLHEEIAQGTATKHRFDPRDRRPAWEVYASP